MKAYELLAHLKHLTLCGKTQDGLEWIGTPEQWDLVSDEITTYEN